MEVSDPRSDKYGQHWSQDDVITAFAPAKDAVDSVAEWLIEIGGIAKHRITHSGNKGWFAFDATVEEAEALLHTEYYRHGKTLVACERYHLPSHIQKHIDYVTPGVKGTHIGQKE